MGGTSGTSRRRIVHVTLPSAQVRPGVGAVHGNGDGRRLSMAGNTMVTVVAPEMVRIGGRGEARRAVKDGQIAMVTAPSAAQARCCGDGPVAGSGEAAMPMPASPRDGQQDTGWEPDCGQARGGQQVATADQDDAAVHDPPVGRGVAGHRADRLQDRVV
jgi:hypothetical protein